MAIKLEMLRVFRAVAEKGSLSGAAEVLGRTPSAISMTLTQLEADVGAPLFETDRKNKLSPLGLLVLDESSRATDSFARSIDAIRRHAASLAGTVRIAAVPSAVMTMLPGVIRAFRNERPAVRLEISDLNSEAVRRRIRLDDADIGIVSASPDDTTPGTAMRLDDLGIACHPDGVIAREAKDADKPSWALLELEPLIANPICRLVRHPAVETAVEMSTLEAHNTMALLTFVKAGLGVTILPRSALDEEETDLSFVVPANPYSQRELRKIARSDSGISPAVKAFWDALPSL